MTELDTIKPLSTIGKVTMVEEELRKYPQLEIPIKHYFSQGVYAREMTVPKGAIVTGHIHKYQQLNILSKGKVTVLFGDELVTLEAPFTGVAPAGSKRIFIALEDSVWTVILATDEVEVEKIEQHFLAKNEQEFLDFIKMNEHPQLPLWGKDAA